MPGACSQITSLEVEEELMISCREQGKGACYWWHQLVNSTAWKMSNITSLNSQKGIANNIAMS